MKQPCGCCAGIEVVTPLPEANRPGLTVIAYRVGTHATFLESMLARLSTLYLDIPTDDGGGTVERIYPLKDLTTRDPSDPSIAWLDSWATVAHVLTFYQERIANEGYLHTATERRSILELARLVGYRLRPGVSASVYLAFAVTDGFSGEILVGTRAQSIPGTGELPQFFETSDKLTARDVWNNLKPRLTRPQVITLASNPLVRDSGTDAVTRDTLYFQGISTNLKNGDALLIVVGDGAGQQVLRFVQSVDVQAEQNRTAATLQEPPIQRAATIISTVAATVQPLISQASSIFSGSRIAREVAAILEGLLASIQSAATAQAMADLIRGVLPQIQEKHNIAVKRHYTRLEPWIAHLLETLRTLGEELPGLDLSVGGGAAGGMQSLPGQPQGLAPSSLGNLGAILGRLAVPPSLQPASSVRLARSIAQAFSPQADVAPRILATFKPAVAPILYKAWANVQTPTSQVRVYALRVKTAPFGHNAPLKQNIIRGTLQNPTEWPLSPNDTSQPAKVSLDAVYDKVMPGSWIVIERTDATATNQRLITRVLSIQQVSRADYGITGRVTRVSLGDDWLSGNLTTADLSLIRGTVVSAQSEPLDLAEEPLDADVEGDTIELASLYDGLESGRWIIVSGARTDIPNVTDVTASELVMVSGVTQGARALLCAAFPAGVIPFSRVYYTTDTNVYGDRLMVGLLSPTVDPNHFPLPSVPNQKYCDQVQLAQGLFVNAYVPTQAERTGDFSAFEGLLVHPDTRESFPGGKMPQPTGGSLWAWRISSEPVHTILTLANKLAYTYDPSTVTIHGNVVKATHGQTQGEVLGNGDGSQSLQKFALHQKPLTYLPAPTPAGAQSTLVVRVNDVEWHEADTLAGLGPSDRSYIAETDDADQVSVIFGNGEHGSRLPTGTANVKAVYRSGIGKPGNVKAQQISQLATQPLGAKSVINPLPATGGADRDSRDQARRNAPLAVMALDRLVSVEDYADFARTYAGIAKASAARVSDGRRQIVHVTIAGTDDIPIDVNSDLYRNLVQALHQNGDPFQPIRVALRKLKLLVMSARIRVAPDYQWESVEPKIRAALVEALGFERRDLGQTAFQSEAISTMQAVAGVSYVDLDVFDAVAEDITVEKLAGLARSLELKAFVEADLARVDPVATDPSQHVLPAELAILSPDLPDTLILTEISG